MRSIKVDLSVIKTKSCLHEDKKRELNTTIWLSTPKKCQPGKHWSQDFEWQYTALMFTSMIWHENNSCTAIRSLIYLNRYLLDTATNNSCRTYQLLSYTGSINSQSYNFWYYHSQRYWEIISGVRLRVHLAASVFWELPPVGSQCSLHYGTHFLIFEKKIQMIQNLRSSYDFHFWLSSYIIDFLHEILILLLLHHMSKCRTPRDLELKRFSIGNGWEIFSPCCNSRCASCYNT